jgi:sugar transferase (PEP-CTERM system associated)
VALAVALLAVVALAVVALAVVALACGWSAASNVLEAVKRARVRSSYMWIGKRVRVWALLVSDGLLAWCCGLAVLYARFGSAAPEVLWAQHGWAKLAGLALVTVAALYLLDLYDLAATQQRAARRWGITLRVTQAVGLAAIGLALVFYAVPQLHLGRGVFLLSLGLLTMLLSGWRRWAVWLFGQRALAERVLILGTDPGAVELARETLQRREKGYEVVGFLGDDPALVGRSLINPCVLGLTDMLEEVVQAHRVNRIVVAQTGTPLPLDPLLGLKLRDQLAVEEGAAFYERLTGKMNLTALEPRRLIFGDFGWGTRLYQRARRLLDVMLGGLGLLCSVPLMALAALAIKLDSPGPVFYQQERVGQHGRRFKIIKLRSMRTDAEPDGPVWAAVADARVTPVGRVLRKLRLDEVPQFINVLRGEMSFIGPRPERPEFVALLERDIPLYAQRHLIKPGLTGWAQVRGQYCASLDEARERHQYDLFYIKNQSPALDALILLETIRVVCAGSSGR